MDKVRLKNTDLEISEIGMGTQQASPEWRGEDKAITSAVHRSLELGVNLIDTAEIYGSGHSEEVVGRAIRDVDRDDVVIATKVYGPHLRYDELLKACDASLRRLGVKQIDLYQVHWPDPWEQIPLRHTMKALEKLYRDGKIRAIGVSNFAVRDLEEARSCLSKTDIVSNQLRYNFLQREIEEEVVPYCRRNGIVILAWSPLAQGVLTGKYGAKRKPKEEARAQSPLFSAHNLKQVHKILVLMRKIADFHGKTIPQVALNWLVMDPDVIPIPGAKTASQAEENAGSVGWRLALEAIRELDSAYRGLDIDYF